MLNTAQGMRCVMIL